MKAEDRNMEYKILKAAEKLFLEQGFAKTTTGQIAGLAGCNQALVHYYYRTKDNLFEKIFEEKIRFVSTGIFAVDVPAGATFEEKIAKIVELHFNFLMQNPGLATFVFNEILSNAKRLQPLIDKYRQYPESVFRQLSAELEQEVKKGAIRPISIVDLLITVVSLNVAPFLVQPILQKVLDLSGQEYMEMLEERKKEIVKTVLARLKK